MIVVPDDGARGCLIVQSTKDRPLDQGRDRFDTQVGLHLISGLMESPFEPVIAQTVVCFDCGWQLWIYQQWYSYLRSISRPDNGVKLHLHSRTTQTGQKQVSQTSTPWYATSMSY